MSSLGVDVGTSRIVLARRVQDDFEFRSELNAFVTIPLSGITRKALEKDRIPHSVEGGEIVVYGNQAARFADLFHAELRRPMRNGVLNPGEPEGPNVLRQLVSHLAGSAARGQKCHFSVPGPPHGGDDGLKYHEAVIRQILSGLGFDPQPVNEGLAVVYAELEESNYTGIGVSCGGGACNVCLAFLSAPVVAFSLPKAGDYVDASAAAATGEIATRLRLLKEESFRLKGSPSDKIHQALQIYYEDVIDGLIRAMREAFAGQRKLPTLGNRPLPLVLSGGTAMPAGFRDRFEQMLRTGGFPLPVSEIRLAEEPLHSTAKGALIAALAEN